MKILILAAGYATRLYPLTKNWPKPLLLVKETPILTHILKKLEQLKSTDEILIITNNKFYDHFKDWEQGCKSKIKIRVINDKTTSEKDRLGSIGDINYVISNYSINEDILVVGGDNLFSFDLKKFVTFAQSKKDDCIIGIYDIKDHSLIKHYGVVTIDKNKRVIDFEEKPQQSKSTLISMCIYYFPKENLRFIKEYVSSKDCHDTTGDYISWLHKKTKVLGYLFDGVWYDIGDIITFYHASVTFQD